MHNKGNCLEVAGMAGLSRGLPGPLEVPHDVLVMCKGSEEAVALVNIAALGRTLQQLVSVLDETGCSPPSATPRTLSRRDLPSIGPAAQQLTDCLASLFAASVQLRHLAQLNRAAALELRTHPSCLELALERQVLSQVQDELSERATALCVRRGRAALPPLTAALDRIKADAAAGLLAIHSRESAMPRLAAAAAPRQQLSRAAAAGAGAAACQQHCIAPVGGADCGSQLCSMMDMLRPGFEQLAATLHGALHQQLPGIPEQRAGPGSGSPLNLASSSSEPSQLGWRPLTPPYARPRFTQLPLPSAPAPLPALAEPSLLQLPPRAGPEPGLQLLQQGSQPQPEAAMQVQSQPQAASARLVGTGMLAPGGWQQGQVMQHQQQQQQRQAFPVTPLQLFSTPAAGRAAHPAQEEGGMAAAGGQVAQPGGETFLAVQPQQGALSPHTVTLSQQQLQLQQGNQWAALLPQGPQPAARQEAHDWNCLEGAAGASEGNLAISGAEAAATQAARSEALRMATRSALRGDAAPSTSTEGSDPQQAAAGAQLHSPQLTTAARAAGPTNGSPGGPASQPPSPQAAAAGDAPADGGQGSAPGPPAALPQRLAQLQQAEGGGGGSQPVSLQCTLRPPSRTGTPPVAAQQCEVAQQQQQQRQQQLSMAAGTGGDNEGFQFPPVPPLPVASQEQQLPWAGPAGALGPPQRPAGGAAASGGDGLVHGSKPGGAAAGVLEPCEADKENRNSSQSQEDLAVPLTQQAEPAPAPDEPAALLGIPALHAAPAGPAPAAPWALGAAAAGVAREGGPMTAGRGTLQCPLGQEQHQGSLGAAGAAGQGPAVAVQPPGVAEGEGLPSGAGSGGTQPATQHAGTQPGMLVVGPGVSTPVAPIPALLLDSQRDSTSPHHRKPMGQRGAAADPDSAGKTHDSGGSGRGSGIAHGVSAAPAGDEPAAAAGLAMAAAAAASPWVQWPPAPGGLQALLGLGVPAPQPHYQQPQQQQQQQPLVGAAWGGGAPVADAPAGPPVGGLGGATAAGPLPSLRGRPEPGLLGLLSAAAPRKRPLSQDAEGNYKRTRFARESQEAAMGSPEEEEHREEGKDEGGRPAGEEQRPAGGVQGAQAAGSGDAGVAAPGSCKGMPSAAQRSALSADGLTRERAQAEGLCSGGGSGSGSGSRKAAGPALAGLLGSEVETGIVCTQPGSAGQPGLSSLGQAALPAQPSAAAAITPQPAWAALLLAEQWAATGSPQPAMPGWGASGVTPLTGVTPGMRSSSGAPLHSASKFAGAAPGATPRFIHASHDGSLSPLAQQPASVSLQGGGQAAQTCTEQEQHPERPA